VPVIATMRLLALLLLLPALLPAQKAAVVDVDSLIKLMPETKIAVHKLDSAFSVYERQLDILSDSMEWLSKHAPHGQDVPSEMKIGYIRKVNRLSDRIRDFEKKAETELESYRLQLHDPIEKKVKEMCIRIAKQKGYAALIPLSKKEEGLLYYPGEPDDITTLVISEIGK
jgi:hypothetical protein